MCGMSMCGTDSEYRPEIKTVAKICAIKLYAWSARLGNSDRDYFQIAPETFSEGLKSKIFLGGGGGRGGPQTPLATAPFSIVTTL